MRYFIELSYKGTVYCGWQRQNNAISVQEVVEDSMQKLMQEKVEIVGCGRTDAGVHARRYVAHFESESEVLLNENFLYHLNCVLPKDISARKISLSDIHARFDAVQREYKYYITTQKNPFKTEYSWHITVPLDLLAMQQAAMILGQYSDFASMCKAGSDNRTTLCHIEEMYWLESKNMIIFTVSADRFLRGMVRALVGTMVDVGRGKVAVEQIPEIMAKQCRSAAGHSAPPQGLFLTNIKYKIK